jgi:hypothetical protein
VTLRLLAAALAALSAWLLFGVAAPARRQRDAARAEFTRLRAERESVRAQLAALERRSAAGRTPEAGPAAARTMRLVLLAATEAAGLEAARIATDASGRGRVAASGRLSVDGPLEAVLGVTDRLAHPDSGLIVQGVTLADRGGEGQDVRLELHGVSVRAGS